MTGEALNIGPFQLALSLVFVLAAGGISMALRLGLAKDLFWGTVRTFAQLFLMGYALKFIFGLKTGLPVLLVFAAMIAFAAHIIRGRVKEKDVSFALPAFGVMLASYVVVTCMVTGVIVGARPWWLPQYFLPIGGMVIGNSMNALAISLERLFSGLRDNRDAIEMRLCLGADYREAGHDVVKSAVKAGMIPSINAMMGVGLVFIPGMMTGQILAGANPLLAVRYQIVIMLMLVASTAVSAFVVISLAHKRCFGKAHQLLLRSEGE